ncbi:hypothetical protein AVU38_gp096 [Ralstonia phage RSL2]|uniref:Uncharacterized protein n=1 Tax=Ralstonia phage RSL2 TaxID=1585840 RepID=A0A0A8J9F3_9CAUD|nr:hypothetical protein AVU38_gp096 [Ralstonia phage RSL2]BAQ02624.1 hypothetical protein [Ralstonia phage RSL2]
MQEPQKVDMGFHPAGINLIPMLEDAIRTFVADHSAIFNERVHQLFELPDASDSCLISHDPKVHERYSRLSVSLERSMTRGKEYMALVAAAKGIIQLLANQSIGRQFPMPPNFPQLRMRIPEATQLILSLVGNASRDMSQHEQVLLVAFGEFYDNFRTWKQALESEHVPRSVY